MGFAIQRGPYYPVGQGVADAPATFNFFTDFPANETPISEGGNWTRPGPSVFTNGMFTLGGRAFGAAAASGTNDAVACLVGAYLPNQDITAVFYENGGTIGAAEIELHLNVTFNSTDIHLYECDMINGQSVNLVKWQGPQSSIFIFTLEAGTTGNAVTGSFINGDEVRFRSTGLAANRLLQVYHRRPGGGGFASTLIAQTHDTTAISGDAPLIAGTPGMGGDNGGANFLNLGWESFSVVTSPLA